MTPDICFLVFAHVRQNFLAHVRDHVQQFYGNYRTLTEPIHMKLHMGKTNT